MSQFFHVFVPGGHFSGNNLYSLVILHKQLTYLRSTSDLIDQIVSNDSKQGLDFAIFLRKVFHNHQIDLPKGNFNATGLCWDKSNCCPTINELVNFSPACGLELQNFEATNRKSAEEIIVSGFQKLWNKEKEPLVKEFYPFVPKKVITDGVKSTKIKELVV
jgi:hypothetical protein